MYYVCKCFQTINGKMIKRYWGEVDSSIFHSWLPLYDRNNSDQINEIRVIVIAKSSTSITISYLYTFTKRVHTHTHTVWLSKMFVFLLHSRCIAMNCIGILDTSVFMMYSSFYTLSIYFLSLANQTFLFSCMNACLNLYINTSICNMCWHFKRPKGEKIRKIIIAIIAN